MSRFWNASLNREERRLMMHLTEQTSGITDCPAFEPTDRLADWQLAQLSSCPISHGHKSALQLWKWIHDWLPPKWHINQRQRQKGGVFGGEKNPLMSDIFFSAFVIFGNWFNVSFIDFYCVILLPSLTSDLPQLARLDTAPQATPHSHCICVCVGVCVCVCGILTGKSCTRRTLLYLLPFLIPPRLASRTF